MDIAGGLSIAGTVIEKLVVWIEQIKQDKNKKDEEIRAEALKFAEEIAAEALEARAKVLADNDAAVRDAVDGKL